jgi:hypothetical protein
MRLEATGQVDAFASGFLQRHINDASRAALPAAARNGQTLGGRAIAGVKPRYACVTPFAWSLGRSCFPKTPPRRPEEEFSSVGCFVLCPPLCPPRRYYLPRRVALHQPLLPLPGQTSNYLNMTDQAFAAARDLCQRTMALSLIPQQDDRLSPL